MDKHAARVLDFYRILDRVAGHCRTPQGAELCREITTAGTLAEARARLYELDEMKKLVDNVGGPSFGDMYPIEDSLYASSVTGACLSKEALLEVGQTVRSTVAVIEYLEDAQREGSVIGDLAEGHAPMYELAERFARTFGPRGEVLDTASPELARIRAEIKENRSRVIKTLTRLLKNTEMEHVVMDDFITERSNRYVVPLTTNFRGALKGIVHDNSRTGQTVFVEPMEVVEINNKVNAAREEEEEEIRRIFVALTAQVGQGAARIRAQVGIVAQLDRLAAKLSFARKIKAVLPELHTAPILDVKNARHPLLVERADLSVVPIDISLGEDERLLLITGANAGGKTVGLKTAGLLAFMAHAGFFIPASEGSRVGWFDGILADIGDEQDIDRNLSTFSAHMARLKEIFELAGEGTLVLIDEMGTGTDPSQGAALSVAVLEELSQMGAKVVATTHLDGLKAYAYSAKGAKNAAVAFDPRTGKPLYQLLYGQAGGSKALETAEAMGVPKRVLDRARSMVGEGGDEIARLVRELEIAREAARTLEESAKKKIQKLDEEIKRQTELKDEIAKERRLAREEARKDAQDLLRRMKDELNDALKTAREGQESVAREQVNKAARDLDLRFPRPEREKAASAPPELKPGVEVFVTSLGKRAVVDGTPKGGRVRVKVGGLVSTVPVDDLAGVAGGVPKVQSTIGRVTVNAQRGMPDLNLIGRTVNESLAALDSAVDKAIVSGIDRFRVVHGRGTGALRKAIREHILADRKLNLIINDDDGDAVTWVEIL